MHKKLLKKHILIRGNTTYGKSSFSMIQYLFMENPEVVLRLLNVSGKKMTEEFAFFKQFGIIGQLIWNVKVKLIVDEKSLK